MTLDGRIAFKGLSMSWIKLDDQWMDHPKIIRAGKDARDMWLASITWCAKHLTDGYFPPELLPQLAVMAGVDVANCQTFAKTLLEVCLWDATDNGYHVHDYLDYNPTKEQTEANRIARSRAGKAGGEAKAGKMPSKILANGWQKSSKSLPRTRTPLTPPPEEIAANAASENTRDGATPKTILEALHIGDEVKNQRAKDAMDRGIERHNGKPDLSWLPENLLPLGETFCEVSNLKPTDKRSHSYWIKELNIMWARGVTQEIMEAAINRMRQVPLLIKDPGSVVSTALDIIAKKQTDPGYAKTWI